MIIRYNWSSHQLMHGCMHTKAQPRPPRNPPRLLLDDEGFGQSLQLWRHLKHMLHGAASRCPGAEQPPCVGRHQKAIIGALKEGDISIRRRALDLMFTMCNAANAVEVPSTLCHCIRPLSRSLRACLHTVLSPLITPRLPVPQVPADSQLKTVV